MYHRVAPGGRDLRYTVHPRKFTAQMSLLASNDYTIVPLSAVVAAVRGVVSLPASAIAITFDDGFLDTWENARPVLRAFGFTATFFLVAGLAGGSNVWMHQGGHAASPLIDWSHAATLVSEGFTVGSHSLTHPRLDEMDTAAAAREIRESKRTLEDHLGTDVAFFAYPYGRFTDPIRDMVEAAGYVGACSAQAGFNRRNTDRFALRRLDVAGGVSLATFRRNLQFGENNMTPSRLVSYYAGRLARRGAVGQS
jgi:peptidoglycan/xylan/chitin deacetylase (PgdA/CDA1 family)